MVSAHDDVCCDEFAQATLGDLAEIVRLPDGRWDLSSSGQEVIRFCPWCGAGVNLGIPAPPAGTAA